LVKFRFTAKVNVTTAAPFGVNFNSGSLVNLPTNTTLLIMLYSVLLQSFKSTIKQGRIIEKDSRRNDDESF